MTQPLTVRALRAGDRAGWEPLWAGYQTFYKVEIPRETTELTFARLLDPGEPMHGIIAESGGAIVGIVHCIFHRSTWTAGPYCYLQDLFTHESARGRGVGRALIEAVYAHARQERASRVYWLTHESNAIAMALYDTIADRSGFVQYRKTL
jgi:GNAT superfamily N-acetyltransferase